MSAGYTQYLDVIKSLLSQLDDLPLAGSIDKVAELSAQRIIEGRVLYAFGASHAGLLVQDQFYRAGGLVPIQPLLPRELMLDTRPVTMTTTLEQTSGFANSILDTSRLAQGDLLLIVSVSGRNAVPVELCQAAQQRGATVVALTNCTYSRTVAGRGVPRLFEVADHVIDMPGVPGDAAIELTGDMPRVGPTSSVIGATILHGLAVDISTKLIARRHTPPVFASANLDDTTTWNEQVITEYQGRLDYL